MGHHLRINTGLEIRHFEKNSRRKKLKTHGKKINNSRVKLKDATKFQTKKSEYGQKMILKLFFKKDSLDIPMKILNLLPKLNILQQLT